MTSALELSAEVERYYVTVPWVARHYGVTVLRVHRAIARKRLTAARVEGKTGKAGRHGWVLDRRLLPPTFPS